MYGNYWNEIEESTRCGNIIRLIKRQKKLGKNRKGKSKNSKSKLELNVMREERKSYEFKNKKYNRKFINKC